MSALNNPVVVFSGKAGRVYRDLAAEDVSCPAPVFSSSFLAGGFPTTLTNGGWVAHHEREELGFVCIRAVLQESAQMTKCKCTGWKQGPLVWFASLNLHECVLYSGLRPNAPSASGAACPNVDGVRAAGCREQTCSRHPANMFSHKSTGLAFATERFAHEALLTCGVMVSSGSSNGS